MRMRPESPVKPVLVRQLIGESLREERVAQGRTLREVSKGRAGQPWLPLRGGAGPEGGLERAAGRYLRRAGSAALDCAQRGEREDGDARTDQHRRASPVATDGSGHGPGRRLGRRTYRRRAASSRSGCIEPSAHVGPEGGTLRRSVEAEAPVGSSGSRRSAAPR